MAEATYDGRPCHRCGGTLRRKCNRCCVECDRAHTRAYQERNSLTEAMRKDAYSRRRAINQGEEALREVGL